jgi:DNA mismatch repair protein MSH5
MAAGMMGGKAPPQGWQFQFSTEMSVYYKNSKMRDLDRDIGDLHGFIVDREVELMQQLMVKVLEMEVTLTAVGEVLAELDCLLAFADATRQCESPSFSAKGNKR